MAAGVGGALLQRGTPAPAVPAIATACTGRAADRHGGPGAGALPRARPVTLSADFQSRLQTVRSHYRVTPWIQPREDEAPLLRSWQRCRDAGMRENECVNFELVSRAMLAELDDRYGALVQAARPETERLAHALRGSGCAVLLFNPRGVLIDRLCDESGSAPALLVSSRKGINLSERCIGTTAPAIALAEGIPYLVGRDAHFFSNTRPFFCVAAPLDSPAGERLGALDITAYDTVPSFDVFSLVIDTAVAIENSLFQPGPERLLVRFHPRAELVGTVMEGLLEVDAEGRITGANRAACRLLSLTRAALLGREFTDLFDRRLQGVFARPTRQRADLVEMHTHVGLQMMARFETGGRPGAATAAEACAAETGPVPLASVGLGADRPAKMRELEREAIERALAALGGNVSAAARQLGISRNTIYRRRSGEA